MSGAAHWRVQTPALQAWFCSQIRPQAPQLKRSFWESTQDWPHWMKPGPQDSTQLPVSQNWVSLQATPHWPQFFGSDPVSTQMPLHRASGGVQTQTPAAQPSGVGQTTPQLPQFCASELSTTQSPLQLAIPSGQEAAQAPLAQTWLGEQATVQSPQWS
jgi:hypothetical protein